MHLKQLVLKGFKSFADRSVLTLEPGVSAVVGPNGSGKSNISDAVLWVLGERNAKNLRGQVMEDVIFAGSSARKSVGVAEVELVLDNSDGTLPVDYEEVSIARRMYRSGESDYLVNGSVVRRMDVLDILHDSGLGTGTHSIIAQGHLDGILQSRPEDRRTLIEEAAGVLKHKQRKEKSQRKLEQMDAHLARVNDVVAEVTRQLGPLERKAKRAERYKEASAQLAELNLVLAVDDLRTLQGAWEAARAKEAELLESVQEKRDAVRAAEDAAEAVQNGISSRNAVVMDISSKQRRMQTCAERFRSAAALLDERGASAAARIEDLERGLQDSRAKRAAVYKQYDEAQAFSEALDRTQALDRRAEEVAQRLTEARGACAGRTAAVTASRARLAEFTEREQAARAGIADLQHAVDAARAAHAEALDAKAALASERKGLLGLERAANAAAGAARSWVVEHNADLVALAARLRASAEYESLVEHLLGDDISSLIAGDAEAVLRVGRALAEKKRNGKVVLLLEGAPAAPIIARDAARAAQAAVQASAAEGAPASAPASAFVPLIDETDYPAALEAAVATLLGDVVVCDGLEAALAASAVAPQARFATRDGIVCKGGRTVFGAAVAHSEDGALARTRRLAELATREEAAAQACTQAADVLSAARERLEESRKAVLALSEELASLRGAVKADEREERSALDRVKSLEREAASIVCQKEQVEAQAKAYAARIAASRARELDRLDRADAAARETIHVKRAVGERVLVLAPLFRSLCTRATAVAEQLEQRALEASRAAAADQEQANAARAAVRKARGAYDGQNALLSDVRIQIGRLEVQVDAAINVIVRDCRTPMETAIALPQLENRAETEQEAFRLRRSIANMGTINPDAAEEFEALKHRSDFLVGQLEDLQSARASLTRIDRYIDERMRTDFENTFNAVNEHFSRIFATLFPGGTGYLELVDPEDMENTGVEVVAQPSGKKITKMTLMSGGEKSLVALALLFAVYATRPTPFYILDEVEAALDDSNLRRLLAYLEDLRKTTQLIMITHQRRTMEMADTLFGVSMQADGVTKVVSQKLDRALQYAE